MRPLSIKLKSCLLGMASVVTVGGDIAKPSLIQAEPLIDSAMEVPEEILEAEIILEARSPIDGSPMTPAEYAQLQDELRLSRSEVPGRLDPKLHRAVILLRLRKILKTVFPFLF